MDALTGKIEVWSRPGDMVTYDDGGWFLIKSFEITGQGKGEVTSLPKFTYPVIIPAGSKQSFYVTTTVDDVDLWYSFGKLLGQAHASDDNLDITEGYALGYPFLGTASPRIWNGMPT